MFNVTDSTGVVNHIQGVQGDHFLDTKNIDNEMPKRVFKRPAKFSDYVDSVYFRSSNVNQKEDRTQTPTPRPCVHCHEIIGSWALMHQHMQTTHRDILFAKKINSKQLETQTRSTVEDQADAPITLTGKKTVDTSKNPSESVRSIQGEVGIVKQLETSQMEEMNVQAEDGRTKPTVTSLRSVCRRFIFEAVLIIFGFYVIGCACQAMKDLRQGV